MLYSYFRTFAINAQNDHVYLISVTSGLNPSKKMPVCILTNQAMAQADAGL